MTDATPDLPALIARVRVCEDTDDLLRLSERLCGHGHLPPNVILAPDTWLVLLTREDAQALYKARGVNIHGETWDEQRQDWGLKDGF